MAFDISLIEERFEPEDGKKVYFSINLFDSQENDNIGINIKISNDKGQIFYSASEIFLDIITNTAFTTVGKYGSCVGLKTLLSLYDRYYIALQQSIDEYPDMSWTDRKIDIARRLQQKNLEIREDVLRFISDCLPIRKIIDAMGRSSSP